MDLKTIASQAVINIQEQTLDERKKTIESTANSLYEFYERDFTDFMNSRMRAVGFCERQARFHYSDFWIDVKHYLNTNNF